MKLIKLLLSAVLFCTLTFSVANVANSQSSSEITPEDIRDMMHTDRIPVREATETTGTPYLFPDFQDGHIVLTNGQTTNVLELRYNTYEQTLEFLDGYSALRMDPDHIQEFELFVDNTVYKFEKGYDARRLSEDDFVRLIIDDEIKFMAKHTTSFQEDVASYGTATQQDEYISDVTYYIQIGDGDIERIRSLNERRVMRQLNQFDDKVEEFANRNDTDFSDPDDVEELFQYYNKLLIENN